MLYIKILVLAANVHLYYNQPDSIFPRLAPSFASISASPFWERLMKAICILLMSIFFRHSMLLWQVCKLALALCKESYNNLESVAMQQVFMFSYLSFNDVHRWCIALSSNSHP